MTNCAPMGHPSPPTISLDPPPIVGSGSGDTYGLEHSRLLGIAEANLVMIRAIAEAAADQPGYRQPLLDIADLARKALVKTGHIKG